jgi:hypothetical protein
MAADTGMLGRLFDGTWRDDEFLVVPAGRRIEPSNDRRVVTLG